MSVAERVLLLKACAAVCAGAFLFSCAFVSFEKFSVSSNVDSPNVSLSAAWLELRFSSRPDNRQAETLVSLFLDGKTVSPEFRWNGSCLALRPQTGWKNGGFYSLLFDGKILLADGRTYTAYLNEYFYYAGNRSFLCLLDAAPSSGGIAGSGEPLVFTFSKAVDVDSFYRSFKLNPPRENFITFSGDGTTVTVSAKNGWENNRRYVWSLSSLAAKDGFYLEYDREGNFLTASDTDFPRLTAACLVKPGDPPQYFAADIRDDPPPLSESGAFALIFSKEMDFFSLSRSIAVTPALKYYILPDPDLKDRIIIVPQEQYAAERYALKISPSAKDISGLSPVGDITVFFSAVNEKLRILGLVLDAVPAVSAPDEIERLNREQGITNHTLVLADRLDVTFRFSAAFTAAARGEVLKHVSLTPLFPPSSRIPVAVCAGWDEISASSLTVTWNNLSAENAGSVPVYYQLKIAGGKNGLANGCGSYLAEDICIIVRLFL